MLNSPDHSFPSTAPSLQNKVTKRKSKEELETQALIIQDGSETTDLIAKLQGELSQFSSKYSQHTLEERVSLELRMIGLSIDAVGDRENNDSSHKGGAGKAGKHAGLDIAKQTGRCCFNELTSSNVVLSELVCSKHANCVDHIGSRTAANANIDSHDRQLGSWASGSSGASPINEKPALAPSSWSPSKGESGEPVNTGETGVNKEAGFEFPPDGYLDLDGLSSLEIPDDIDSWAVEPADLVAFLEIPMDDLLDVNRCFRRK